MLEMLEGRTSWILFISGSEEHYKVKSNCQVDRELALNTGTEQNRTEKNSSVSVDMEHAVVD